MKNSAHESHKIRVCLNTNPGPKVAVLPCAHCKIDHPVEQADHDKYVAQAKEHNVKLEEIWWCGRCYLAYLNQGDGPKLDLRVDCEEHDVPAFPEMSTQ
jgi:hypothetical protein